MKLYLAIVSWDYEGQDVIGVFDTREAIDKAMAANISVASSAYTDAEVKQIVDEVLNGHS